MENRFSLDGMSMKISLMRACSVPVRVFVFVRVVAVCVCDILYVQSTEPPHIFGGGELYLSMNFSNIFASGFRNMTPARNISFLRTLPSPTIV